MVSLWTLAGFAVWLAGAPPHDANSVWIRHYVHESETVAAIAHEYDVTPEEILYWNRSDVRSNEVRRGDLLRIKAKAIPRPRQLVYHRVARGETWGEIAAMYGVEVDDLERWNRRYRKREQPPRRAKLKVWAPSGVDLSQPPPDFFPVLPTVPNSAESVGLPYDGRLKGGVPLPETELYHVRFPRLAYGSSLTIRSIMQGIANFRMRTGYAAKLYIGAISRQSGRHLAPHVSHQSGRDVDIWLPTMPWVQHKRPPEPHEVDWFAAWELVRSFVETDRVEIIFLDRKLFRRLRLAAMRLGASDADIAYLFGKIHHSKGHVHHMHVRFQCSPNAPRCKQDAWVAARASRTKTAAP